MSREHPNAVAARQLWSAVADGNAEAIRALLTEDVVWLSFGRNPLSGEYRGPDAVLDYLAGIGESSEDLVSTLDGVFAGPRGAVIAYTVKARLGAKRLDLGYLLLLKIEDGQITEGQVVPTDQYQNDRFWS